MTNDRDYPNRPFVGASALIMHNDHILLVQRGKPPAIGIWSLPGGAVEAGETLKEAIEREVREETGLQIEPHYVADLVEILRNDPDGRCERHFVIAVFFCTVPGSKTISPPLVADDDAMDARWVSKEALAGYPLTEGTLGVIERIIAGSRLPS